MDPFWILILAAILTVLYYLADSFTTRHIIKSDNKFLGMLTYLVLGSSVGLVINFLLCQTALGKIVDPKFTSISAISSTVLIYAIYAGIAGAVLTAAYLWAFKLSIDPALVVPLSSLVILYVAFYEVIRNSVQIATVIWPIAFVLLGIFLGLFNGESNKKKVLQSVFLILIVFNLCKAFNDIIMVKAVRMSDGVTFGFYRFLFLTIFAWLFSLVVVVLQKKIKLFMYTIYKNLSSLLVISLIMIVVFVSGGLNNRGAAATDATTLNIISSVPSLLIVILSALVNKVRPNTFNEDNVDRKRWVMRFVGAFFMIVGVFLLK